MLFPLELDRDNNLLIKEGLKQSTNTNKTNNYLSPRTIEHRKPPTAYGIGYI